MDLPPAAAPARVDHPRAVRKLHDLALVAVLDGLAEGLPRLAVVVRPEERVAVVHVDDRVEKSAVLRLDARAGRDEDKPAFPVALPERPFRKGDVLRDVAGLRPCPAVVGRLLHVELKDAVPLLRLPDVVEQEYLFRLRVDYERGVRPRPVLVLRPLPLPREDRLRPRNAAVRRATNGDVYRLRVIEVTATLVPRVANRDEVAVWRGAERGNPVYGGLYALDGVATLEEDLLGSHERIKRDALGWTRPDLRLRARHQLDVLVLGVAACREGEAVLDRLGINRHDRVVVSGEPAVLDRNPLAGERLCEEIREPRATNLPARLLGAAEVLDKAVDALDGVGAFRLQRCESRDLEPCAVAEEIARERRPVVAVLARVDGEAVCLADLPVKRQHGLPAGALAAKAADRNALAGI